MVCFVWFRLRARGLEQVPAEGGGLVLVNHESFLDPIVIGTPMTRSLSYLARDSLFRVPFVGWFLRNLNAVPIDRKSAGASSIKQSIVAMKQGMLVTMFPEGTRTKDGELGKFRPGFITILRRTHMPIYPVALAGTRAALSHGAWFVKPKTIRIVWGKPVLFEEYEPLLARGSEADMVEFVRDRVADCREDAQAWCAGRNIE